MLSETIHPWLLSLPVWGSITWLVGMGLLYITGINLSRKRSVWWLVISFIAVLMSFTYMNAQIYSVGEGGLILILPVLVAAILILAMVGWGKSSESQI